MAGFLLDDQPFSACGLSRDETEVADVGSERALDPDLVDLVTGRLRLAVGAASEVKGDLKVNLAPGLGTEAF